MPKIHAHLLATRFINRTQRTAALKLQPRYVIAYASAPAALYRTAATERQG